LLATVGPIKAANVLEVLHFSKRCTGLNDAGTKVATKLLAQEKLLVVASYSYSDVITRKLLGSVFYLHW
jgi:hypothetical protein